MKLNDYKLAFAVAGLIGILLIASPTIGMVLSLTEGEQFSELYLLSREQLAEDYPFNVNEGREYLIYLGVGNHLNNPAYYVVQVKFGNQSDLLPNSTSATPSPLQNLYEYRFLVDDNQTWEAPLAFSISGISFTENRSYVNQISINDVEFDVIKDCDWNAENTGFYYKLFAELWIFNLELNSIQFHNRFVSLQLNLTRNG